MKTLSSIAPGRLSLVEPAGMRAYIEHLGWQHIRYPDERVLMYAAPGDAEYTLPVPATRQLKDYVDLVDRVVVVLADIEDRAYEDILQLLCNHAILKMHAIDTKTTPRGTLGLPAADVLVKRAKDLVTYSACAEIAKPQPHYRRPIRAAAQHADRYELGQTEPGSFVLNIITPGIFLTEANDTRLTDIDVLEHRVVRRIIKGAEIVRRAASSSDASAIAEGYGLGFNANMCDIVADTIDEADLDELSFSALGIWDSDREDRLPTVSLTKASVSQLEKASVMLKEAPVDQAVVVTGYVTMLRNEDAVEPDWQRHVQISWLAKSIHVHVMLSEGDYAAACDAHRDGRRVVLEGVLHHEKRKFYLQQYRQFHIEGSEQPNLF